VDGNIRIADSRDVGIAYVRGEYAIPGMSAANCRLIASAPELLEALKELMRWVPSETFWHTKAPLEAIKRARTAITKAESAS
jgi:hypothetical protein